MTEAIIDVWCSSALRNRANPKK